MRKYFENIMPPALSVAIVAVVLLLLHTSAQAAGGADYGRGPETDPVASAAVSALATNLNGANIVSGNIPVARITNALQNITAGDLKDASIQNADLAANGFDAAKITTGNLPVAQITNALQNITAGDLKDASVQNADLAANGFDAGKITTGNLPLAQMTNAFGTATLYSGSITNNGVESTNVITVLNGVIVSLTTNP